MSFRFPRFLNPITQTREKSTLSAIPLRRPNVAVTADITPTTKMENGQSKLRIFNTLERFFVGLKKNNRAFVLIIILPFHRQEQ